MFLCKSELKAGAAAYYEGAEAGWDGALEQSDGQTVAPVSAGPATPSAQSAGIIRLQRKVLLTIFPPEIKL